MTCEFSQRDDVIIGYVEGTLPPYPRKKFEEHYFLCAECFQALQRLETVIALLRHEGKTVFAGEELKKS